MSAASGTTITSTLNVSSSDYTPSHCFEVPLLDAEQTRWSKHIRCTVDNFAFVSAASTSEVNNYKPVGHEHSALSSNGNVPLMIERVLHVYHKQLLIPESTSMVLYVENRASGNWRRALKLTLPASLFKCALLHNSHAAGANKASQGTPLLSPLVATQTVQNTVQNNNNNNNSKSDSTSNNNNSSFETDIVCIQSSFERRHHITQDWIQHCQSEQRPVLLVSGQLECAQLCPVKIVRVVNEFQLEASIAKADLDKVHRAFNLSSSYLFLPPPLDIDELVRWINASYQEYDDQDGSTKMPQSVHCSLSPTQNSLHFSAVVFQETATVDSFSFSSNNSNNSSNSSRSSRSSSSISSNNNGTHNANNNTLSTRNTSFTPHIRVHYSSEYFGLILGADDTVPLYATDRLPDGVPCTRTIITNTVRGDASNNNTPLRRLSQPGNNNTFCPGSTISSSSNTPIQCELRLPRYCSMCETEVAGLYCYTCKAVFCERGCHAVNHRLFSSNNHRVVLLGKQQQPTNGILNAASLVLAQLSNVSAKTGSSTSASAPGRGDEPQWIYSDQILLSESVLLPPPSNAHIQSVEEPRENYFVAAGTDSSNSNNNNNNHFAATHCQPDSMVAAANKSSKMNCAQQWVQIHTVFATPLLKSKYLCSESDSMVLKENEQSEATSTIHNTLLGNTSDAKQQQQLVVLQGDQCHFAWIDDVYVRHQFRIPAGAYGLTTLFEYLVRGLNASVASAQSHSDSSSTSSSSSRSSRLVLGITNSSLGQNPGSRYRFDSHIQYLPAEQAAATKGILERDAAITAVNTAFGMYQIELTNAEQAVVWSPDIFSPGWQSLLGYSLTRSENLGLSRSFDGVHRFTFPGTLLYPSLPPNGTACNNPAQTATSSISSTTTTAVAANTVLSRQSNSISSKLFTRTTHAFTTTTASSGSNSSLNSSSSLRVPYSTSQTFPYTLQRKRGVAVDELEPVEQLIISNQTQTSRRCRGPTVIASAKYSVTSANRHLQITTSEAHHLAVGDLFQIACYGTESIVIDAAVSGTHCVIRVLDKCAFESSQQCPEFMDVRSQNAHLHLLLQTREILIVPSPSMIAGATLLCSWAGQTLENQKDVCSPEVQSLSAFSTSGLRNHVYSECSISLPPQLVSAARRQFHLPSNYCLQLTFGDKKGDTNCKQRCRFLLPKGVYNLDTDKTISLPLLGKTVMMMPVTADLRRVEEEKDNGMLPNGKEPTHYLGVHLFAIDPLEYYTTTYPDPTTSPPVLPDFRFSIVTTTTTATSTVNSSRVEDSIANDWVVSPSL
jgi:hypothetical protein